MRQLFKEKGGRFGSFISLIAVCAMLMLFFLALPEMLTSVAGRIFAVTWALTAILVFTAHARRFSTERPYYPQNFSATKNAHGKKQSGRRFLRG